MDVSRWVNAIYIGFAIILFTLVSKTLNWIIALADRIDPYPVLGNAVTASTLIAVGLTVAVVMYLYRKPVVYTHLSEIIVELSKVTWPDWDETRQSTLVVIVFTAVVSFYLFVCDFVWQRASTWVLGG
jgi:preprotein translocase SecE subunit